MTNLTLMLASAAICLDSVRRLYSFYRAGSIDALAFIILLWALFYIGIPSVLFAYFGELNVNGSPVRPQPVLFAVPLLFLFMLNVFLGNRYFAINRSRLSFCAYDTGALLLLLLLVTAVNVVSFARVLAAVMSSGAYELAGGELRDAAYGALAGTSVTVEHVSRIVGLAITGLLLKARRIGWSSILYIVPVVLVDMITLGRYLTISALLMYVWARPELVHRRGVVAGLIVTTIALFYYRTFLLHISGDAGEQFIEQTFFSTDSNTFEALGEFINTYATFHMAAQATAGFDGVTQAVNVFSYLLPPGASGAFLESAGIPSVVEVTTAEILKAFGAHPAHLSAIDLLVYNYFAVLIAFLPVAATFVISQSRGNVVTGFIGCYLYIASFACLRGSVLYYYSRAAFVLLLFVVAFVLCREAVVLLSRGSSPTPSRS
jgi:hypothetical protein